MDNLNVLTEILSELQIITQEITNSTPFENFFNGLDDGLSLFNGFAEAIETLNDFDEVIENIQSVTGPLIEGISKLSGVLNESTTKLIENASAWVLRNGKIVASTIASWAQHAAQTALNAITQIGTALQSALNFVMSMNPIALVIIAVTALVAAFVLLWNKCEGFRNFFINMGEAIKNGVSVAVGFIRDIFSSVVSFINNKVIQPITGFFSKLWSGIGDGVKSMVNVVINALNGMIKGFLAPFNLLIDGLNLIPGVKIKKLSFKIPTLATGGFPSMGQMFIAREAGPELVGTIGSKNAVVNNNQIVKSVSAGVYKAVREAMGSGNRSDKIVMTLDKKVLGEATIGYINGKTRQTGVTPILV